MKKEVSSKGHPWHIVEPSPWPLLMSLSVLCCVMGGVCYMHSEQGGGTLLLSGMGLICYCLCGWFMDVVNESTYSGFHTLKVQKGISLGMKLFMVSEVMFFVGFFWAYLYVSMNPSMWMDLSWPPSGMVAIDPASFPLMNTMLLLTSGMTVTISHLSLKAGDKSESMRALVVTLLLGLNFSLIQVMEYAKANFFMSDGIYGSCFYMMTGFHGLHVIIGSIFLMVCLISNSLGHFTYSSHLGFNCAMWYWHFVDMVWIFLYVLVYIYSWMGTGPALGWVDFLRG